MLIDAKNILLIPLSVVHFVPYYVCLREKKEMMFKQYFAVKQKSPLARFVWFQWSGGALFSFSWQPVNWLPRILPAVSESGL